jgi:hypothetical protein
VLGEANAVQDCAERFVVVRLRALRCRYCSDGRASTQRKESRPCGCTTVISQSVSWLPEGESVPRYVEHSQLKVLTGCSNSNFTFTLTLRNTRTS